MHQPNAFTPLDVDRTRAQARRGRPIEAHDALRMLDALEFARTLATTITPHIDLTWCHELTNAQEENAALHVKLGTARWETSVAKTERDAARRELARLRAAQTACAEETNGLRIERDALQLENERLRRAVAVANTRTSNR